MLKNIKKSIKTSGSFLNRYLTSNDEGLNSKCPRRGRNVRCESFSLNQVTIEQNVKRSRGLLVTQDRSDGTARHA